jgi:hypothetical protein
MRSKVWPEVVLPRPSGARLGLRFLGTCCLVLAILRATEHSAALEPNSNYEKICFNVHHRSDRRRVYRFLHTTGNYNFDHGGGNCQGLAVASGDDCAGKEEEDHG